MRSAICLPVCELALSLSFPEVQPRAPAIYNMVRTNDHQFFIVLLVCVGFGPSQNLIEIKTKNVRTWWLSIRDAILRNHFIDRSGLNLQQLGKLGNSQEPRRVRYFYILHTSTIINVCAVPLVLHSAVNASVCSTQCTKNG